MAEPRTPLEAGLEALRNRDRSRAELEERLATRGFTEDERDEALATLARTGLLDDARFAEGRAQALAARGAGDAMIRDALEGAGVASELVEDTVQALEPEVERARRVAERRGPGPRTARYLAAKGFAADAIGAVVASGASDELP